MLHCWDDSGAALVHLMLALLTSGCRLVGKLARNIAPDRNFYLGVGGYI